MKPKAKKAKKAKTAAERWPRMWEECAPKRKPKAKAKRDELIPLTFKWEITYGARSAKAKPAKRRK